MSVRSLLSSDPTSHLTRGFRVLGRVPSTSEWTHRVKCDVDSLGLAGDDSSKYGVPVEPSNPISQRPVGQDPHYPCLRSKSCQGGIESCCEGHVRDQ